MSRRAQTKTPQQRAGNHNANTRQPPHPREVVAAVESLYVDKLKPYGRILRKRLTERALPAGQPADVENAPDVDIRQLRQACGACSCLQVEDEEGGDWSAVLINREPNFVDIYSPNDEYPAKMWEAASVYFESLSGDDMTLPGGRYACAQVLVSRRLPFLNGCTLGQICHIVQLAISQKKVLGYLNGSVVPYGKSQSMVKEQCASSQQPCSGPGRDASGMELADWTTAKRCLEQILETAATPQGLGVVPLSNVKRLFRSRFSIELSETMLGHSKLSELLQDPRFDDVCRVKLEGHGYIVVQHKQNALPAIPSVPSPSLAAIASLGHQTMPATIPNKKVDHNKFYFGPFCPNEPAKVLFGSAAEPSMMSRRRPPPLADFSSDYTGAEVQDWYHHGLKSASPRDYERSCTESTACSTGECGLLSAMPSPAPSFSTDFQTSPSSSPGNFVLKAAGTSRRGLPPPPAVPPPPPPGFTLPPGLEQVVRAPPGLAVPPGLEHKLWTPTFPSLHTYDSAVLARNCHVESLLPELAEDLPASDVPESADASPLTSNESQRVLCLWDHV